MRAGPDAGMHMSVPTGLPRGTAFTSRGLHPKRRGSFCSFGPTRKVSERSRGGRKGNGSMLGQKNHLHRGESFSKKSKFSDLTQDL